MCVGLLLLVFLLLLLFYPPYLFSCKFGGEEKEHKNSGHWWILWFNGRHNIGRREVITFQIRTLGLEAVVFGKKTFHIKKKVLHAKCQCTDFCCVDNGLLYTIVVTWMGKSSAGNHSSMNIKFILELIHLSVYFLFAFLLFFLFLSLSFLMPLFIYALLLLACFDNYYGYCKGLFSHN